MWLFFFLWVSVETIYTHSNSQAGEKTSLYSLSLVLSFVFNSSVCAACVIAINDVQLLLLLLLSDNLKYSIQLCSLICRLQHCNLLANVEWFILAQLIVKMPIYCINTTTTLFFRSHIISKSAANALEFSLINLLTFSSWKWIYEQNGLHRNDELESKAIRFFLGEP